jgi:hypothetical protein
VARDFKKSAQLELPQRTQFAEQIRQKLGVASDSEDEITNVAFEAFLQAGSLDEMRCAATQVPILTGVDFIQAVEQGIAQQVTPEGKSAFERGLASLRQTANEQ